MIKHVIMTSLSHSTGLETKITSSYFPHLFRITSFLTFYFIINSNLLLSIYASPSAFNYQNNLLLTQCNLFSLAYVLLALVIHTVNNQAFIQLHPYLLVPGLSSTLASSLLCLGQSVAIVCLATLHS